LEDEPLRPSVAGPALKVGHEPLADSPAPSLVVDEEPFDLPLATTVAQANMRKQRAVSLNRQQGDQASRGSITRAVRRAARTLSGSENEKSDP
jgi:hypothetical protein